MPFRPAFLHSLAFRAAVAIAGLAVVAWWGLAAAGHWSGFLGQGLREAGAEGPRWKRSTAVVVSFRRQERETPRTLATRDTVVYEYFVGVEKLRGTADSSQEVGYEVRRAGSAYPPLVPGLAARERGATVDVWYDLDRPAVSTFVPQREYVAPEAGRPASLGSALAYTGGALVVAVLAWKLATLPLDASRVLDARAARRMRERLQAEIPEADDVALPPGLAPVNSRGALRLEFPRRRAEAGDGASWLFLAVFAGGLIFGNGHREGTVILPALFVLLVGWGLVKVLGSRLRRSTVEVSPAGLVVKRSYGIGSRRWDISKSEIDYLEPCPTDARLGRGPADPSETFFGIVAVLGNGRRVLLGDNISGIGLADTLVRRIGAVLGLHPEQCFTAAAMVRFRHSPIVDALRSQEDGTAGGSRT